MDLLRERKQNSIILRACHYGSDTLLPNLARSIKLAGEVEAVGVSPTDSGEGMLSWREERSKSGLAILPHRIAGEKGGVNGKH